MQLDKPEHLARFSGCEVLPPTIQRPALTHNTPIAQGDRVEVEVEME